MLGLLGSGDEILRLVERSVTSDVHVRGNEITLTGAAADSLARRLRPKKSSSPRAVKAASKTLPVRWLRERPGNR